MEDKINAEEEEISEVELIEMIRSHYGDTLANHFSKLPDEQKQQIWDWAQSENAEKKEPTKLIQEAKRMMADAKRDLNHTRTLYAAKEYVGSTYHLQQAVEKASKAYSFAMGTLGVKEAQRVVSHKTPMAFTLAAKNPEFQQFLLLFKKTHPNLPTDFEKLESIIKDRPDDLSTTPADVIRRFIQAIDKIEKNWERNATFDKMMEEVSSKSGANAAHQIPQGKLLREVVTSYMALYLLGAVTYSHAETTRYSSATNDMSQYKPGLGVVDTTLEIVNQVEHAAERLQKYVDFLEKTPR